VTVSLPAFECHFCGSWFADQGVSVGSLDPSLGEPGDWRAGEVCDHCIRDFLAGTRPESPTTSPVTATHPLVTDTSRNEGVGREITRPAVSDALEALTTLRACVECGKPFEPSRSDARFCGAACRVRAHRRRRGAAASLPVTDEMRED
jgi:predicted nucleic acid-binding Zn ribbon protein